MNARRTGLALCLDDLRLHRRWLLDGARDIEMQDLTRPEVLSGDWLAVAAQVRDLLAGHDGHLGVHGPFWNLSVAARDPAARALTQDRLLLGLDFAELIGGTHLVVHSPFDFFGHPLALSGEPLDAELERAHETLGPVVQRAEDQGVTVMIENIYDLNPAPLLALAQSFQSEHVALSLDTGHAHLMTARGGLPPQAWIEQLGVWLGHVHLNDNDVTRDQHLAPGRGTVHWAGVQRALAESAATPRLLVEVRPDQIDAGRAWVEQLGDLQDSEPAPGW